MQNPFLTLWINGIAVGLMIAVVVREVQQADPVGALMWLLAAFFMALSGGIQLRRLLHSHSSTSSRG